MSVYVDAPIHRYGRMLMCHLLADTPTELHAMAARIGVARKWYQRNASTPHYDICKSKRVLAVAAGAIELDRQGVVDVIKRIRASILTTPDGGEWCADYRLERIQELMRSDPDPKSPAGQELNKLVDWQVAYETAHYPEFSNNGAKS